MAESLLRGGLIEAILALVAIEAIALFLWKGRAGGDWSLAAILANLVSGAALLAAVGAALRGRDAGVILVLLNLAFLAHLTDLWLRMRR